MQYDTSDLHSRIVNLSSLFSVRGDDPWTSTLFLALRGILGCISSSARLATSNRHLGVRYEKRASCMPTFILSRGSCSSEATGIRRDYLRLNVSWEQRVASRTAIKTYSPHPETSHRRNYGSQRPWKCRRSQHLIHFARQLMRTVFMDPEVNTVTSSCL